MIDKGVTKQTKKETKQTQAQKNAAIFAPKNETQSQRLFNSQTRSGAQGTAKSAYTSLPDFTDAKIAAVQGINSAAMTADQKYKEVNAAKQNVQSVLTGGAGIYERLMNVQELAQTDKSTGTKAMLQTLQRNYDNYAKSVEMAAQAARDAEQNYADAYKKYQTARDGYDAVLKVEEAGMETWRKSIRQNYDQISLEIINQQQAVKDAQKAKQKADSALAEISARRSSMLDGAMVFPGEEEAAMKAAQDANKALQNEQKKLGLLQEERAYSRYFAYDQKQSLPDFAEKSQYKTTATGTKKFNSMAGVYTDTGFGDILYDYINGNEEARTRQDTNSIANNTALMGFDKSFLREMTQDEVSTYNYVYATEGKDAAERYIGFLTTERNLIREGVKRMKGEDNGGLTQRQTEKLAEKINNFAMENPKLATAAAIAESPLKGLSYLGQTADYLGRGKIDQYAGYNKFTRVHNDLVSGAAQRIAENLEANHIDSKGTVWAYQLSVSMAEFLLNSFLSGAGVAGKIGDALAMKAAEAVSLTIMGTGAAADSVIEAKERGLDDNQAYAIGTIAGTAEAVTELVSIEALFGQAWDESLGKFLVKNIAAEGSEEIASDGINLTADILIAKDKSEWAVLVDKYTKETGDPNKAFGKAVGDTALNMMLSGLGGAISGGVMAGFTGMQGKMMQELYESIEKKNIQRQADAIADMAENMPTIQPAQEIVQPAQEAVQPAQETSQPKENVKQESVAEEATKPQQETVADKREEGVLYGSEERLAELAGEPEKLSGNSEQVQQSGNSEQLNQQQTAQQTQTETKKTTQQTQQETQTEAKQTQQQTQKATEPIKSDNAQEIAKQAQREALSLEDSASKYNVDAKMVEAAKRFQAQTGRAISYFRAKPGKSGTVDGFYDRHTNTIFINASSTMQQAVVFGHELTHSIERSNIYQEFSDLVFKRMGEMGQNVEALRQDIRDLYAANGVSYANEEDLIDKEIVAKFVQDNLLTNEEEIRALVRENRKTAQRVKDWIDRMLAKFGNKDAKERAFLQKAREMYAQALEETKPKEQNEQAISEQADKAFSEATEDEKKRKVNDLIEQQLSQMSVSPAEATSKFKDSAGNKLSKEQEKYFINSKVRDQNGNLLVMHHGTKKGGFTVFHGWSYFTSDKKYASKYTNKDTGETMYEVYVNAENPFDTRNAEIRELFDKEYKGKYSNTPLAESGLPDWTDGYDLVDFIEENGYKYDAIVLDEGPDAETGERIISYVVREPNQIKSTDNKKPTEDDDIRFSISEDEYSGMSYDELEEEKRSLYQQERELTARQRTAASDTELMKAQEALLDFTYKSREAAQKKRAGTASEDEIAFLENRKEKRAALHKRVEEAEERIGIKGINDELYRVQDQIRAVRKASDAAWEREGAAKENAAIEKSGMNSADYFRKKAMKEFKATTNFNEAGYLLPDGKMLNFSGGQRGRRTQDHREIGSIYEATRGTQALNRFLADGNVRIMAESPGIDVFTGMEPTAKQYAEIRRFVNSHGSDGFYIDFSDAEGNRKGSYEFDGRVSADRVINDIKYFYQNGTTRKMSSVAEFHSQFSISQDEYAPTFYSQMERTISEIKQPKLGAASVVSYLRGRGVKAEEIKWSGIEAWLEGKKSVTREELAEFAAGSRLQIEEEKFGRGKQQSDVFSEFFRDIEKIVPDDSDFDFYEVFDDDGNLLEAEFAEGVNKIFEAGEISEADKKKLEKLANEYGGKRTAALSGRPKWNNYATPRGSRYREIIFKMPGENYENPAMITHWGRRGILAHARIQDMKTDSGTMLFVDEIQSDWHNEGSKRGYGKKDKVFTRENTKIKKEYDRWKLLDEDGHEVWFIAGTRRSEEEAYKMLLEGANKYGNTMLTPEAPFKDTYQDFVMKRLIREAAENGYDSVGWTTAEMQSRRFSAEFAEGYRIEYDQQIPSFLKKYGKKWGGKVTQTTIPSGDTVWQFRIPDAMKQSVLHEGQPQFSISIPEDDTYTLPNGKTVNTREYLRHIDEEGVEGVDFIYTYKSMSYWGEDENGNAILRSPMAEFSEKNKGSITDAYIVSKDPSRPNWYKAVEEPSKLVVKVNVDGKVKYLPVAGNENLIAEDWSNLYYPLIKKNEYTGELENPTYARYNPYEHSSNLVLNDQFDAGYRRPNLVTVKMKVPLSEGEAKYRAKYSKDQTGWTGWKSGKVAGRISQQKEGFKRDVYLSRYAAPVEIMPNSWVAQKYKEYMEGTDVEVPDNVVSPDLLEELIKAGVPIKKKPRPKFMEKAKPASYAELERYMSELKSKQEQTQFAISEDEKMQQDWDKAVRDQREIAVMTGELAQAQEVLANDMAEAFQRQTDRTIGETMERTGNFPQKPAPKRTQKEEARSFIARKFIDSGDAVSQMGKKAGDKTLYNYYSQARRSSAAAYSMINKAQTNIRGERVGDSLQAIFDGIKEQWGEEYYKQLELLLLHRHNINRMSREKPMELKAAREEFRAFREVNYELAAYADYEIERMAREPDSYYHHEAQEYIELRDNMRKLENTRNKAVFNWDVTAQISNMVCQTLEERLRQVNERFEDDAKKIYAYIDNLMKYRIDSGLMTERDYEELKKIYPNYVPVYRMVSQSEQDTRERRKIQIGKTVGRAVGGEESIMSLGKALEKQTFSVVREGSKNRWGTMLLDRRYARSEEILGVESQKREFHEDTFDELEDPTPKRNNTFTVRNSGEVVDITVSKELFEAVNALAPERVEENALTKALRASNDLFKKLCTGWNPAFMVKNIVRDTQDALLYSKHPIEWMKNLGLAYGQILKDGKYWQQYQALGGAYSGLVEFQNPLDRKAPNALQKIGNKIEALSQATEQASRLAEFMAVCKSYKGERLTMDQLMEAIEASAEVTVNFGRSGTWGKVLNSFVVPFWNPGIQGLDKAVRTFSPFEKRTANEWMQLAVRCAILGILPGVINAALWGDDDEYEDIKERDKDTNYLFRIRDGMWLKLPRGRVISLMQSGTRRAINMAMGKEKPWEDFWKTGIEQVAPANPLEQNLFAAWIEADLFDRESPGKTWYGGNIESQRLQGYAPGERYDASTDAISKAIGKVTGLSPKKINYILDQYTGVAGDLLLPTLSQKGARGFFEKAFIVDTATQNRLANDFYKKADELKYAKNSGKGTELDEILNKFWSKQSSQISEINKAIRKIEEDPTTSKSDKEALSRIEMQSRNTAEKTALDTLDEYRKAAEKYLKQSKLTKPEDRIEEAYREANREVMGADYAIRVYNKQVYDKACGLRDRTGITMDQFYDFYFPFKAIEGKGYEKSNAERDLIASLNLSEKQKIALYQEYVSQSRDDDIQAFSDVGMKFKQFVAAQNAYSEINANGGTAGQKRTEFARWAYGQKLTDEQRDVVMDYFTFYSNIPADTGKYEDFRGAGMDDKTSYAISKALTDLKPLDGKSQVSEVQKMEAITSQKLSTEDQIKAISVVASESTVRKIKVASEHYVEPKMYADVWKRLPEFDADGNGSYKNAEIQAAIDAMGDYWKGTGTMDNAQKAVMWQLLTGNKSAKNNPYSRAIGQEVLDAVNALKTAEAEEEE